MKRSTGNSRQIISYLTLRKVIGLLGLLFPILLSLGCFALGDCKEIPASISHYYHTNMGDVFVGILFAIGLFLFSYKGYDAIDSIMGTLGCVFALGVALFPTESSIEAIRSMHFVSAALLFGVLSYFSLVLFTKTGGDPSPQKKKRNDVYKACGIIMLLCIVLIGIYFMFLKGSSIDNYKPVFVLESLSLFAFGFSWLIKGETLWKDVNKK